MFAEVRRVLRDDGTLWLNLGDSYGGHQPGNGRGTNPERATLANGGSTPHRSAHEKRGAGIKEKDLVGIPWMVAFALRADGWYLRSDIIWEKPSAMPESVADRPTNAHEHLFLLAKCGRYFYDAGAIAEPVSPNTHARLSQNVAAQIGSARANGGTRPDRPMKAVVRAPKTRHGDEQAVRPKNNSGFAEHCCMPVERRNRRNVWRIASQPFTGAHFATFPPALVEPCILAGSKPGDVVLDPFTGTGTVAAVARDHGRRSVGIELNPDYIDLAAKRLAQGVLDFGGVA